MNSRKERGGLLRIEAVHRGANALKAEGYGGIHEGLQTLGHQGLFFGGEVPEDVVDLRPLREVVVDAEA